MTIAVDPFFEPINEGEWNACVGKQGDEENYVDGFLEAAQELAEVVMKKNFGGSRDTLVMPILYNCRHGLELSLKYAIKHLYEIGMISEAHPPNHDIASLWQHLQTKAVGAVCALGDSTLRELVKELEPYVNSLAAIDDDGQELRYAQNKSGEASLKDLSIVNLKHVRSSIHKLSELLGRLKNRVHEIIAERVTNSHTSNCSRKDLIEIAGIVGNQPAWKDESFTEKKRLVMSKFNLSSGKFSDALDKIKNVEPLAALIGIEASLKYLSDEKAIEVMSLWVKDNPRMSKDKFNGLGTNYFEPNWAKHVESWGKTHSLDQAIFELLSIEEFADLESVYYLGRNKSFGELYARQLTITQSNYNNSFTLEDINHITSKTNLLDAFADGCERMGRPSLAEKLLQLSPKIDY